MLLLLHALIPHINIVPSFPVFLHIYTTLVSLLFGTVIPISFNILMKMFLIPCFTVFLLYRNSRMPYYVSIKPYNSTVQEFCAVQLRLYGRVGPSHFHSQYQRWRAGILRKKADYGNRPVYYIRSRGPYVSEGSIYFRNKYLDLEVQIFQNIWMGGRGVQICRDRSHF